jgi:hypothetical protein
MLSKIQNYVLKCMDGLVGNKKNVGHKFENPLEMLQK